MMRVDNKIRPSDRQFFHTLIPDTIFGLRDTCIHLDQKDERDFTVLANISWKDREPSLRYPPVPPQCTFGRSSGFICVLLDDGNSCHYVSGWGQDRVQALVDGRYSSCGHRQHLRMMLHALGLMHEHDRGDALRFVSLHPRLRVLARLHDPIEYRIPQDDCSLFRQNASSLPFDFASVVLHDGAFEAESVEMDYQLPLVPKRAGDVHQLLARNPPGLSHFDRLKLRHLYGCEAKNCPSARPCGNFGFRNELCQCECAPGFTGNHCELRRPPPEDPCLHAVTHSLSFALNETSCLPRSREPFNFTVELAGEASHRFAVTVDLTAVRAVLEPLRLLPSCEHARLYFSGSGEARPQVLCAERLVLSPVTLRTAYRSDLLLLVLNLPDTPRERGQPDPATAAIGAVHLSIISEPSPADELRVDTSHPLPPPPTTTPTTTSTAAAPSTPEIDTEPPTEPPPAPTPPTARLTSGPPTEPPHAEALPVADLGLAQRSAPSSAARTAGIVTAVILVVLAATVLLVVVMLHYRRDPDEIEFEQLRQANDAGEESIALYAVTQQPQPQEPPEPTGGAQ
ncbi:Zinc metalloproteinase nas-20 [Amphibalanus amphitrite]|uniref:Zinc metalloproteinase nas-20 n=1 Tax=Amphibalanus amphitrite TaxID=1232801 RepID=A0A6A4XD00_AMPAM|nr:Zinc metalloproteinase nas-20 [Amphibalanus amphitrite]